VLLAVRGQCRWQNLDLILAGSDLAHALTLNQLFEIDVIEKVVNPSAQIIPQIVSQAAFGALAVLLAPAPGCVNGFIDRSDDI
jgi:hypothetical protein